MKNPEKHLQKEKKTCFGGPWVKGGYSSLNLLQKMDA